MAFVFLRHPEPRGFDAAWRNDIFVCFLVLHRVCCLFVTATGGLFLCSFLKLFIFISHLFFPAPPSVFLCLPQPASVMVMQMSVRC